MIIITAGMPEAQDAKLCEWLASLNVIPQNTYRIHIDPRERELIVYQYAVDEDGKKIIKGAGKYKEEVPPEERGVKTLEPRTINYGDNAPPDHIVPALSGPYMEAEA